MSDSNRCRLADLLVDPEIQPRLGGIDGSHVLALQESPDAWGALLVVRRNGKLILVDGFHRLAAGQNLGLDEVLVRILDPPEDGDLRALAFSLNAKHGRPLTLSDRRAEAARLLTGHPELSDREIGRRCGLSQPTVARIREELEAGSQIEHLETRIGADSKVYPAQRKPGQLPPAGLTEMAGNVGARVFSGKERARQRKITGYLKRLSKSLQDQGDLLEDPEAAAEAVRLVLGDEQAGELADHLADTAGPVLAVAAALGFEPEEG